MVPCLFCNIVARTTPAKLLLESPQILAFQDIRPVAPAHALVIPKRHITGMDEANPEDASLLGEVLLGARRVAGQLGLGDGYRLVINQGANAGQSVFHLHCHVIGGRPMAWPPG